VVASDECTYCGTGGEELDVARHGVFADEWFPEETPWSVVRPGVPACRGCAQDVRRVQLRLWLTWRSPDARARSDGDPLDIEIMTRRLVRALYRWETNERLPMDAAIQSVLLSRRRPADVRRAIDAQGLVRRALEPGLAYWFARAADADGLSIWYVALWSRIFLFAKTLPLSLRGSP